MKALVKTAPEPGLHLIDVPEPVAGPNEVLVKVLRDFPAADTWLSRVLSWFK